MQEVGLKAIAVLHMPMDYEMFKERLSGEPEGWILVREVFNLQPGVGCDTWRTADESAYVLIVHSTAYLPDKARVESGAVAVIRLNRGVPIISLGETDTFPSIVFPTVVGAIEHVNRIVRNGPRQQQEKPRVMLLLKSFEEFGRLVRCVSVQAGPTESVIRDDLCHMYRVPIEPGVTCDDYIWCVCPNSDETFFGTREKLYRWTVRNGQHAYGIVLDNRAARRHAEGQMRTCRGLSDVAAQFCSIVGASEEASMRAVASIQAVRPDLMEPVDIHRGPVLIQETMGIRMPEFMRQLMDSVHGAGAGVDLSVYDPDDRVAIEAILAENARDGVDVVFPAPAAAAAVVDDARQVARERAFDARLREDAAIRANYEARRMPPRGSLGSGDNAVVQAERRRQERNPRPGYVPAAAAPVSPPAAAPEGRVVGRVQNTRLREQVSARAAAARAREVVSNSEAAKKLVEPRLEKSDDVDAVATTAEENTCVICVTSHVTTLLFPCLHYRFCSGCISAWKSGGNENCPVCRAKIELVLQPHGNLTLDDLRARSAAPAVAAVAAPLVVAEATSPPPVGVAEAAPPPSVGAKEPPRKKAKKEAAPPKRRRSTSKKKK